MFSFKLRLPENKEYNNIIKRDKDFKGEVIKDEEKIHYNSGIFCFCLGDGNLYKECLFAS